MRHDRAWYEQALADEMRGDYARRRDDAAWTVREYGGEVTFGDEPDWESRAKSLIENEMARLAFESIRQRMSAK